MEMAKGLTNSGMGYFRERFRCCRFQTETDAPVLFSSFVGRLAAQAGKEASGRGKTSCGIYAK
jgi:hypothetical protein